MVKLEIESNKCKAMKLKVITKLLKLHLVILANKITLSCHDFGVHESRLCVEICQCNILHLPA